MQTILFDSENNGIKTISYAEQQQVRLTTELLHTNSHNALVKALASRSRSELIKGFCKEMSAKNRAYYFILESGLIHQFHQFCQEKGTGT
jgi:hypothetical protein